MSRGIGKTQKQLIELGGATALLFDCVDSLTVYSGSRTPVPDFQPGKGRDGIERWYGTQLVTTTEYLKELIAERDFLYANTGDQAWSDDASQCEKVAKATLYSDDIFVKAHSFLFDQDHRERVYDPDRKHGEITVRVSDDIKKAKNKARVTVSRAFASMQKRGLVVPIYGNPFAVSQNNDPYDLSYSIMDRRGWQEKGASHRVYCNRGKGQFYLVIDSAALATGALQDS